MPDEVAPVGDQLPVGGRPPVRPPEASRAPDSPAAHPAPEAPDFPADTRTVSFSAGEFASGGEKTRRFVLSNPHHAVLHVRLTPSAAWLRASPSEVALGPGEKQAVLVRAQVDEARAAVHNGAPPSAPVQLVFQRVFPGAPGVAPSPSAKAAVYVRLPLAVCPACGRSLADEGPEEHVPDVCPFCFERLRPCPECGAPNSWLARTCVLDASHVVRAAADWPVIGGDAGHTGSRRERPLPALSRRWSFPSVPPSSREAALAWSAPAAAYGLVAAAAATHGGDAHLHAFDVLKGGLLWEPYPLPDPVYPERGGVAIANGRLFTATVEGVAVCVDVLRGTRVWETKLDGRVFGAPVPAGDDLLIPAAATSGASGCLFIVEAATGRILREVGLAGASDVAPAAEGDLAFVHDDSGTLTALEIASGRTRWTAPCGADFDVAPVVRDGKVFSATRAGTVLCHEAATGNPVWQVAVTSSPVAGTPAYDAGLLYVPADDGMHLVSDVGRAVRRYSQKRPVRSQPVVLGGTLFFGSTDGNVYGVGPDRSLAPLYETGVGSQIVAAPAFADGALFVCATNGVLYALAVG